MLNIESKKRGDVHIIKPIGEIDASQGEKFDRLFDRIAKDSSPKVVIDLSQTVYIDSAGIGFLVYGLKTIHRGGGTVKIANLHPNIVGLFEITKMPKLFQIYKTVEEALVDF
ncbi:MAG: STAS domain-containing protein [bacterium]